MVGRLALAAAAALALIALGPPRAGLVSHVHAITPTPTPTALPTTTFTNTTGSAAGFLHVQSNFTVATLPSVNAPGCGVPAAFDSGFEYWEIVWPGPCVDPGESVSFDLPYATIIYGYYWWPSVPVVSVVHPAGPPSDELRVETQAFVKGAELVQNAPGCPPPAFQYSSGVGLTWSSTCVDSGEKVSIHIGAPGPVTSASSVTWGPAPAVGGLSFDSEVGGPSSAAAATTVTLGVAFAAAPTAIALAGAAWFARRRRAR